MAYTALGMQLPQQQVAWVRESIKAFRAQFFFQRFTGTDSNNIVQVVNELKATPNGDRAFIGLVQDLRGSGIVGDNDIDGRMEALESSWVEIHCDQLRKAIGSKGRVDDQRSVFNFRNEAKDKAAYWRARIMEEFLILCASGISLTYNTDGSTRLVGAEDDPATLAYAADITAPSAHRYFSFNGTNLVAGDTTTMTTSYVPKYGMIVDAMAEAKTRGVKPLIIGGKEYMVYLCHPKTYARLLKDSDFRTAIVQGEARGPNNPIFTGATVTMDGLVIHTNNRVYTTMGRVSGTSAAVGKWGPGWDVEGTRSLLLGCQALAFGDIWGSAKWYEGKRDHDAKNVISVAMYTGIVKPKFISRFDGDAVEDFGVIAIDLAL
jgi:N4-gp56 family major capsid protein